jgi:trehalose/maltose hydrolase-like predicted phosphorylase
VNNLSHDPLARRFEAIVFDWDGTAVPDRAADASAMREVVEALCAQCVDVVVVSGTHVDNIDGQLRARPRGPGRLLLALNRGSELFEVGSDGPEIIHRRVATPAENDALTAAAQLTVERLAARGLEARVVSERLNRRKIDLIPVAEWADPPKAQIAELLRAVEDRLAAAGIAGLPAVAALAAAAAREAGLPSPRITSDAKHVEIGLTDKADSARAFLRELRHDGIAAELVLVGGDEFGDLGRMPGSDALMLVPELHRATVFSVGVEPDGVPNGVLHRPGGPPRFVDVLHDQLRRRADVPRVAAEPGWSIVVDGVDPERERAVDARLTLADGVIGTSGAPLLQSTDARAEVLASGVYADDDLLSLPSWAALGRLLSAHDQVRRTLDLHTGALGERVRGDTDADSIRFSSLAAPGLAVLRADVAPEVDTQTDAPVSTFAGARGGVAVAVANASSRCRVERFVAHEVATDHATDAQRATARATQARRNGFERALRDHRRAWAERWEHADVLIDGDDDLQLRVRFALYHLMASSSRSGESAIGARGVTGHAYRGHVFWDADVFVLPFLAATDPPAARSVLEYRIRRLARARKTARDEHLAGARFPWESAASGADVTPTSGRTQAGQIVPIRNGQDEVHIVGDVAWAAACYAGWSGDPAFATGRGLELLVESARYWRSRARVDPDGRAHLFGVIGPDEYHEPVDDDAFTNVLARWNLRTAAAWTEAAHAPDEPERAAWRSLADALVDGFDPATGVYEQFAGFYDLEPLRIADVAPRRPITADLLLGRERVQRAQVVKQADVLMLHHLIPDEVAAGSLVPNLEFYEPRTAHGSSLSPGIHAALFARAGQPDRALDLLRLAAAVDLDDLTGTEAGGVHLATMGSVWQALAFGFAGLDPLGRHLSLDPQLPTTWGALELALQFRGARLRVRIERDVAVVSSDAALSIDVRGRTVQCAPGRTEIPYAEGDGR